MKKLTQAEKNLVEALDTLLQDDTKLGLKIHDDEHASIERGYEYLHNQIDEMFAIKTAELVHSDSIRRAFTRIHNYKYIDDPSFIITMDKEMVGQAVPAAERQKAVEIITSVIEELKSDQTAWAEKDFGFNQNLDEIKEISQPEQPSDFEILDIDGWSTEANVELDDKFYN